MVLQPISAYHPDSFTCRSVDEGFFGNSYTLSTTRTVPGGTRILDTFNRQSNVPIVLARRRLSAAYPVIQGDGVQYISSYFSGRPSKPDQCAGRDRQMRRTKPSPCEQLCRRFSSRMEYSVGTKMVLTRNTIHFLYVTARFGSKI